MCGCCSVWGLAGTGKQTSGVVEIKFWGREVGGGEEREQSHLERCQQHCWRPQSS